MIKQALVFCAVLVGCQRAPAEPAPATSQSAAIVQPVPARSTLENQPMPLRDQIRKVKQSTVAVARYLRLANGQEGYEALGSGVVVAPHKVLTCHHVVTAKLPPGAALLYLAVARDTDWGTEPIDPRKLTLRWAAVNPTAKGDTKRDLALLDVPDLNAPSLPLGSGSSVAEGDDVFFVGHPTAGNDPKFLPRPTVATAIIAGHEMLEERRVYRLDGSVNPGNSGGAVVLRSTGELVGIIDARAGSVSSALKHFVESPPGARMILGNVDPVEVQRQVISEMNANMQLGVGFAIDADEIKQFLAESSK